jgi:hypothetical protein
VYNISKDADVMVVRTLRGEGGRYPRELIGVLKKERRCWGNRAAAECDYSLEYSGLPLPETLKPAMAAPTAAREAGGVTLVDVVSGRALDHRNRSEVQRQWMAWRATVRLPSGRRRRLGLYPSREAAVRALDTAVIATYGPTEGVTQAPLRTYAVDPGLRKLPVGELGPLFERLAAEGAARLPRCGKCETCAAKANNPKTLPYTLSAPIILQFSATAFSVFFFLVVSGRALPAAGMCHSHSGGR